MGHRALRIVVIGSAAAMFACASAAPSPSTTTGLTGVMMRGPVTPVCRVDVPCDAPFSATFNVERNGRRVTQFQSDATGQFTVLLAPGAYIVVPNTDAPVISPASQMKSVTVADNGMLTVVRLTFDTGIR
ncbi:MAG TPA: hypothetical protein VFU28_12645 [Vicinamibacterales bacterium]|nr:hypothetical protein [Vicinamibacterales bacterium]